MIRDDKNEQDPVKIKNVFQSIRDNVLADFHKRKQQSYLANKRRNFRETFTNQQKDAPRLDLPSDVKARLKEEHDKFFAYLNQGNLDGLIEVIRFLRDWISSTTDPLPGRVVNDMEMIPPLMNLLSDDFSDKKLLQTEIAWLLANISAGTSEDARILVEMNIIPVMARALEKIANDELHENIMWTFANIAGENNLDYRDQILEQRVLNTVVKNLVINPQRIVYYRTAGWLISNLVRGEPFPSYSKVEKTFGALTHLIEYPDETIQQYTLLSLTYLSEEAKETHIKSISENGLVPKIVQSINSKNDNIAINAVKVAGNLAKGNKPFLHVNLSDYELFRALPTVLESPNVDLRRNACKTLSNILGNEFDDHDYLEDFGALDCLIKLAAEDKESNVRAQALLCLQKYLESATTECAMVTLEKGAIEVFLQNLESDDVEVIENSIRGLYRALEQGEKMKNTNGGINVIASKIMENGFNQLVENLQTHPSEEIALQVDILCKRFIENDLLF